MPTGNFLWVHQSENSWTNGIYVLLQILNYFSNRSRPTKLHTKQNSAEESDFTEADMQFEDHSELFDDDEYAEDEAEKRKKKKKIIYVRKRWRVL